MEKKIVSIKSEGYIDNSLRTHDENFTNTMRGMRSAGRRLVYPIDSHSGAAERAWNSRTHYTRALLQNEITPKLQAAKLKQEFETKTYEAWSKTQGQKLLINSETHAKSIVAPKWQDRASMLLLAVEGIYTFSVTLDVLGGWSLGNTLQSAVVAMIIMAITMFTKSYAHLLPRFFKHICFGTAALSAAVFIYYSVMVIRAPEPFSVYVNKSKIESKKEMLIQEAKEMENENAFNISLILTLMFGSLCLTFSARDPKETKDAELVLTHYEPVKDAKMRADYYQTTHNHLNQRLATYTQKSEGTLKTEIKDEYHLGAHSRITRLFHGQDRIESILSQLGSGPRTVRNLDLCRERT